MISKRQLISSTPSKRLTLQFISDTPIPKGYVPEIYNADGIVTNKLFSTAAFVIGNDFSVDLSLGELNFTANEDDDSQIIWCITTSSANYTDKWSSNCYGVEIVPITTGYDYIANIIEAIGWNDTNSIACEYNFNIIEDSCCVWSLYYNGRKIIFVQEDGRLDYRDNNIIGPSGVELTPIENNEVVPIAAIKVVVNGNALTNYRYSVFIDDIGGKVADQWFDELKKIYPSPSLLLDGSSRSSATFKNNTLKCYWSSRRAFTNWDDAIDSLKNNGYLYVLPITKEVIDNGTITSHIRIIENILRTVQIETSWDQGINGPNIPTQTIELYDTTPFSVAHDHIAGYDSDYDKTKQLYKNFNLIYDKNGVVSENATVFKYTSFVEYFIPRESGNHILHMEGSFGDNVRVDVRNTYAYVYVSGRFVRSLKNFSFTRDTTVFSDSENYRFSINYDNTIGWYIASVYICIGAMTTDTNNPNSTFQWTWSTSSEWKMYPKKDDITAIVNNSTIDYAEYVGYNLSKSSRFIFNKPTTVTISDDPNFFVNHESDTQWSQLPIELRNVIDQNWSFDMKETEWR